MRGLRVRGWKGTKYAVLFAGATVIVLLIFTSGAAGTPNMLGASGFVNPMHNLVSASPEQVAQFATKFVKDNKEVRSGTPAVLLTRAIKKEDLQTLNLTCPAQSITIEEPPLVLVALKGDFAFTLSGGMHNYSVGAQYVVYVFDQWNAEPAYRFASIDGGRFKKLLNDPRLPASKGYDSPLVCPTYAPLEKKMHYGDTAPGFTPLPTEAHQSATNVATATQGSTPPRPIPTTYALPEPISTAGPTVTNPR